MSFAVAFDLDGVLVDLPVDIDEVRRRLGQLFEPLGYAGGFRPVLPSIDRAAEIASGGDDQQRAELWARGRRLLDEAELRALDRIEPRPQAVRLVAILAARGVPLGLVTNNSRSCAERCLEKIPAPWTRQAIVSRDDVTRWKPSPDGVLRAAGALLPEGGAMWFIGDTDTDVEAARAANERLSEIEVSAVLVGRGEADVVVRDVADLIERAEAMA